MLLRKGKSFPAATAIDTKTVAHIRKFKEAETIT
jgi:hypothetical protein